ncbi:MAG: winged helix-turn-helix transcriptional regulator [Chlorobia bacterium]|nr:winged helix-turn-helix transcriptional regulator [Fimbriimonadaceae bacterium]
MLADGVWKALADSTRRSIIQALSEGKKTTTELCEQFDGLTRFAVMKHLDVLEGVGLVMVKREGRNRWNSLNRTPLATADAWLARHVEGRRDMLQRIKRIAEEGT